MKSDAVLFGPCVGELYWEAGRFVPHFIWKKRKQFEASKEVKFVVFTRPERFDLYGLYSDILVPLRLESDGTKYIPNCFRLDHFPQEYFDELVRQFRVAYSNRFNILEHIYPIVDKYKFQMKYQFQRKQMDYSYCPRKENFNLLEKHIPKDDKPWVALAPRYRNGLRRNWKNWQKFYDLVYDSNLFGSFNFIIVGKCPDYTPDEKGRFFDINKIPMNSESSTIGLTVEVLKKSILTVGSQSGIPNISLLVGTPALEFGHQKRFHTLDYNVRRTRVEFIEDSKYILPPEILLHEMEKMLKKLRG